ncbi:hypothetical protein JCM3765_002985 [Sporobolomyces pararoseus]
MPPSTRARPPEYPSLLLSESTLDTGYYEQDINGSSQPATSSRRSLVSSGSVFDSSVQPPALSSRSRHLSAVSEEGQEVAVSRVLPIFETTIRSPGIARIQVQPHRQPRSPPREMPLWLARSVSNVRNTTSPSSRNLQDFRQQCQSPASPLAPLLGSQPGTISRSSSASREARNSPSLRPLNSASETSPSRLNWRNELPANFLFPTSPLYTHKISPGPKPFDLSSIYEPNLFARQMSISPPPQRAPLPHTSSSSLDSAAAPSPPKGDRTPPRGRLEPEEPHNPVPLFEEAVRLRSPSEFMMSRARPSQVSRYIVPLPHTDFSTPTSEAARTRQGKSVPTENPQTNLQAGSYFLTPEPQNSQHCLDPHSSSDLLSEQSWKRPPLPLSPTLAAQARDLRLEESRKRFERELSQAAEESFTSWRSRRTHNIHFDSTLSSNASTSRDVGSSFETPQTRRFFFKSPPNPYHQQPRLFQFDPSTALSNRQQSLPSLASSSSSSFPLLPNDENVPPLRQTSTSAIIAEAGDLARDSGEESKEPLDLSPLKSDDILLNSPEVGDTMEEVKRAQPEPSTPLSTNTNVTSRPADEAPSLPSDNSTRKITSSPSLSKISNPPIIRGGTVSNKEQSRNVGEKRGKVTWNPVAKAAVVGKILQGLETEAGGIRGGRKESMRRKEIQGGDLEDDPIEMD